MSYLPPDLVSVYYASGRPPLPAVVDDARRRLGLHLLFVPTGAELVGYTGLEQALRHGALQMETLRSCLVVLADLTPCVGPAIDPDALTAVGIAAGMGRPVFAFSEVSREAAEAHGLPVPRLAGAVVRACGSMPQACNVGQALLEVDRWLRTNGHRR